MTFSSRARTGVKCIRLDNRRVWNLRLKHLNHITRQNIGSILFARMNFYSNLARDFGINFFIESDKMFAVNVLGEVNFSFRVGRKFICFSDLSCARRSIATTR